MSEQEQREWLEKFESLASEVETLVSQVMNVQRRLFENIDELTERNGEGT